MYKIIYRFQLIVLYTIVFLLTSFFCAAQNINTNKYGLKVIETVQQLQLTINQSPLKQLVSLHKKIKSIVFDLRYSTENNFMHQALYPKIHTTYLRKSVTDSLFIIQKILKKSGLGLKIFDAYRPYYITEKMWQIVKDDRYAADPKLGSNHNRGIAVDLTIINLKTKQPLNMGTDFDNFTDSAHHHFLNLLSEILQNRMLLKTIMEQHGFKALETEWWHYSFVQVADFEILNISFEELRKLHL